MGSAQLHGLAVHLDPLGLEALGDIAGRHRAEQLVAFARLHGEGERDGLELGRHVARARHLGRGAAVALPLLLPEPAAIAVRRQVGEPAGQQEVAGVAVLDGDDVACAARASRRPAGESRPCPVPSTAVTARARRARQSTQVSVSAQRQRRQRGDGREERRTINTMTDARQAGEPTAAASAATTATPRRPRTARRRTPRGCRPARRAQRSRGSSTATSASDDAPDQVVVEPELPRRGHRRARCGSRADPVVERPRQRQRGERLQQQQPGQHAARHADRRHRASGRRLADRLPTGATRSTMVRASRK